MLNGHSYKQSSGVTCLLLPCSRLPYTLLVPFINMSNSAQSPASSYLSVFCLFPSFVCFQVFDCLGPTDWAFSLSFSFSCTNAEGFPCRGGQGREARKDGKGKNNGEGEREAWEEQRPGRERSGGKGKWRAGGEERGRGCGSCSWRGWGRGLISISNGCEMRLAPLEAVRV